MLENMIDKDTNACAIPSQENPEGATCAIPSVKKDEMEEESACCGGSCGCGSGGC